jgi:hypothetical protein
MTVAFNALYPEILTYAPGAPDPAIDLAIWRTADMFCRRALIWRHKLTQFSTTPGDDTYTLTAPTDTAIVGVVALAVDGVPLEPAGIRTTTVIEDWPSETGPIESWALPLDDTLVVYPIPGAAQTIDAIVALSPDQGVDSLDDLIGKRYRDVIIYGTLARLLAAPGTAYTNPQSASAYANMFLREMSAATLESDQGFAGAPLRVAPSPI